MITREDVGGPDLNIRQLVDQVRDVRPHLNALLITGFTGNAALAIRFLDSGVPMITKPFSVRVLADKIGRMVRAS